MCDIPVPVADEERVVRAVFSNHLKKNRLSEYLFHPGSGPDEVSVMRSSYLAADECKARALQIKPANPAVRFKGMAVIAVSAVRAVGSQVTDSRQIYCGHAHVSHGLPLPPEGDPLLSVLKIRLDERLQLLREQAQFFPDPDPTNNAWTGAAF
jgi:hypothetical protein